MRKGDFLDLLFGSSVLRGGIKWMMFGGLPPQKHHPFLGFNQQTKLERWLAGIEVVLSDGDARVLPLLRSNCCDFSRRSGMRGLEVIKLDFASEQEWEKGRETQIFESLNLVLKQILRICE